jgi:hypothetical protein
MSPAPEAGVEVVVVEPLSGVSVAAGRTAGLRRRRARVARQRVGREAGGLDGAHGPPGGEVVVVVLHWFLWLARSHRWVPFHLLGWEEEERGCGLVESRPTPTHFIKRAGLLSYGVPRSAVLLCISVCATLGSFGLIFFFFFLLSMITYGGWPIWSCLRR